MTEDGNSTDENYAGNWLLYDGECPLCSNFVRFMRLKEVASLRPLNARDHPALVQTLRKENFEINESMILQLDGKIYRDSEVMFLLNGLGSDKKWLQWFLRVFFRSRERASVFYPICVFVRNTTLFLLRRRQI